LDKLARFLSKYPFLFPILLSIVTFVAIGWYVEKLARDITQLTAFEDASKYSTTVTQFRNFYSDKVIPNLKGLPDVTITHDYVDKKGAVPFPATLSIDFNELLSKQSGGAMVRVYSNYPWPWRQATGGPRDDFDRAALVALKADPSKPYSQVVTYNGQPVLRYATAIVMKQSCLGCHNSDPDSPIKNWKVGDVRGAQEIILPLADISKESQSALTETFIIMLFAAAAAVCLLYLTLKGLRKSLQLSEEVAQKGKEMNVKLQGEIEERKKAESALEESNRHLEDRVKVRTKELDEKNVDLENTLVELKQTQQQMVVQEKMASLGQLTAGIAHEIKNPLNFVNNFSELSVELVEELQELIGKSTDKFTADDQTYINSLLTDLRSNSDKINTHGKRADSIVRDMLMHSRGVSTEKQDTDLTALLDEYVNLAYHGIRAQDSSFNAKIEKNFDTTLEKISVFSQEVGRVFLNIINNALYASNVKRKRSGGVFLPIITLTTEQTEKSVVIKIKDNGEGIEKSIADKIFNPFFTTKPTGEGTGLGLSICYDIIVQEHQGTIEVNSVPGEYAEFVITLPKKKK